MNLFINNIRKHLEKQYDGIFSANQIEAHIDNYIKDNQSSYLIEKISPFVQQGKKILDIGSGYGSFVIGAAQKGFDSHGVELEFFEHEISRERAIDANIEPSRFLQGSALNLPYSDQSFDVVTFWNVLEHISDYKKAVKEAKRVLKSGGLIFIIAPNYFAFRKEAHYHLPWFPLFPKTLARLYLKLLGRKTSFLDNCIFYITYFGIKKLLKAEGFSISIDSYEKILKGYTFKSSKINAIVNFCKKIHIIKFLMKIHFFIKTNAFANSIDLIAKK